MRRVYRLGVLHPLPRTAPQFAPLFDSLRRQGFLEGRNLAVDPRGFGTNAYHERAVEIISSGVDVLYCGGDPAVRAAQQVSRDVPIVGVADDMVGAVLWHPYRTLEAMLLVSAFFPRNLTESVKNSCLSLCPTRAASALFLIPPQRQQCE
jgi:hypothetical protein